MQPERVTVGQVLVRLPNWLGDALMARPFLLALRRHDPAAHVVAMGPRALLELLAGDRAWDEAVSWPPAVDSARSLRARRWETSYVLPPSFSSAWFASRLGARRRIGFAGEARSWLLTHAPRRPARGDRHLAREYVSLLEGPSGSAEAFPLPGPLQLPKGAAREAETILGETGVPAAPLAILAPGAIYGPAKRWPLARFVALAIALRDSGHAVIACGGAAERGICEELAQGGGGGCFSLAGRTSLGAQAALCARAAIVVSNDSGMAHLAAATGAPTVALFGSTSSAWTAPLGPRVRIVQRAPVCSPCFQRTCSIGYVCLTAIAVRDVLAAIAGLRSVAGDEGAA